jgi:hypothetical protein
MASTFVTGTTNGLMDHLDIYFPMRYLLETEGMMPVFQDSANATSEKFKYLPVSSKSMLAQNSALAVVIMLVFAGSAFASGGYETPLQSGLEFESERYSPSYSGSSAYATSSNSASYSYYPSSYYPYYYPYGYYVDYSYYYRPSYSFGYYSLSLGGSPFLEFSAYSLVGYGSGTYRAYGYNSGYHSSDYGLNYYDYPDHYYDISQSAANAVNVAEAERPLSPAYYGLNLDTRSAVVSTKSTFTTNTQPSVSANSRMAMYAY